MARTKGMLNLSGNLEVNAQAPLDARTIVPTEADLTVASNFPYPYVGLEVYVIGTGKKFRLTNLDTTQSSSWQEIGEGGSGSIPVATANTLGGVKIGSGILVQSDGTISVSGGGGGGSITPSLSVVDADLTLSGVDITVKSEDEVYNVTKNMGNYRYITFDLPWEGNYVISFISPSSHVEVSKNLTITTLGGYEYFLHDIKYGYFDFLQKLVDVAVVTEHTYTATNNGRVMVMTIGGASSGSTGAFTQTFSTTGMLESELLDMVSTGSSANTLSDGYTHGFTLREVDLTSGQYIKARIYSNSYYASRIFVFENQKPLTNATKVFTKGFYATTGTYQDYTHTIADNGTYLAFALGLPANTSTGPYDVDIKVNGTSVVGTDKNDELHFYELGDNGRYYNSFAELTLEAGDELYLKIGAGKEQGALMGLIKLS
jgi:hypothetical protein